MRCHDAKEELAVQRDSYPARPAEYVDVEQLPISSPVSSQKRSQTDLLATSPSHVHPGISTERIMRAVEQQRRITQELEELQNRQQQRNAVLRVTIPMLFGGVFLILGILLILVVFLSFFQPNLLVHILTLLGNSIAMLVALTESIESALPLIPSNSWLLSGTALIVVLMMGMWLRLMRTPREAKQGEGA